MGVLTSDAPQWFLKSFVRSAVGAGATADTEAIEAVGQSLLNRWADENRHFHNLRHLASVLHRVDELAEETHEPDLVRLAALVNAIVRHAPDPADFDAAVLNDADLAMLAAEPQRYKDYKSAVRAEYAHIPAEDYLRARIRVIERLLARKSLFLSPMGAAWEEPARQNLDMELHRLRKEQAKLGSA